MADPKTPAPDAPTLIQKLAVIHEQINPLHRDGRNSKEGYAYVSSSAVLNAIRTAMQAQGVLLVPSVERTEVGTHTTKAGAEWHFTQAWLQYTWVNVDNPADTLTCKWYGQGLDSGDHGPGKALTYAEKYFLLKFFQVPTDADDPDADERPHEAQGRPQPRPAPAPAPKDTAGPRGAQGRPQRPPASDPADHPSISQIGLLLARAREKGEDGTARWTLTDLYRLLKRECIAWQPPVRGCKGGDFKTALARVISIDEFRRCVGDSKKGEPGLLDMTPADYAASSTQPEPEPQVGDEDLPF